METITECAVKLEEINTRISGLINDNENKSMLLRQKFNDKYKNVVVHTPGDPPHAAQKVVQDIIESNTFKPTNTKATFLADKFKNTRLKQFLKQELDIEDGRVSTNMPVITRWGSHLKMYQTLMKHKGIMFMNCNNQSIEEMENVLQNVLALDYIHADLPGIVFFYSILE